MFQFSGFPSYDYFIHHTMTEYCSAGFPHSEICGSQDICSSPQLIAACHVLLRLLMPRHPPCALHSLILFGSLLTKNYMSFPFMLCYPFTEKLNIFVFLLSHCSVFNVLLVGLSGLEPPTSRLSGVRSNLLSYKPISFPAGCLVHSSSPLVEMRRIELLTPCLQGRCSPS